MVTEAHYHSSNWMISVLFGQGAFQNNLGKNSHEQKSLAIQFLYSKKTTIITGRHDNVLSNNWPESKRWSWTLVPSTTYKDKHKQKFDQVNPQTLPNHHYQISTNQLGVSYPSGQSHFNLTGCGIRITGSFQITKRELQYYQTLFRTFKLLLAYQLVISKSWLMFSVSL